MGGQWHIWKPLSSVAALCGDLSSTMVGQCDYIVAL